MLKKAPQPPARNRAQKLKMPHIWIPHGYRLQIYFILDPQNPGRKQDVSDDFLGSGITGCHLLLEIITRCLYPESLGRSQKSCGELLPEQWVWVGSGQNCPQPQWRFLGPELRLLVEEDVTDPCGTLLNCLAVLLYIICTLDSVLLGNRQPRATGNALPHSFIFLPLLRPFPGFKVTLQLQKENKGLELKMLWMIDLPGRQLITCWRLQSSDTELHSEW